ncbi:MAG: hypothetical protein H6853_06105 [Rhodospirillales bacterium]|nr:hypothetical protein [Alphaproteobacteria bacterium]USO03113.1 MAG: hypothetical protein H6853_06105 [Rhodospirillales bacterium]
MVRGDFNAENAGKTGRFSLGEEVLLKHHYYGRDYLLKAEIVPHRAAPDGYCEATRLYSLAIREAGGNFYRGAETWAFSSEIEKCPESRSPVPGRSLPAFRKS